MIEKFCNFILNKMRKKMPDMTDENAEIILYGLQLLIGEMPKMFILFGLSFLLGIGWLMLFAFIAIVPYKAVSGGFHLHTHMGCIISTVAFFYGVILISKFLILTDIQRYILVAISFIFGILMVSLYAPADTEEVPIISKKERKFKKIMSYIMLTATLGISLVIKEQVLSNILIVGSIFQSISISRLAYIITKNKYGHEVYATQQVEN